MQWVSHTKNVLRAMDDVENALRDAVLAGREYLMTGSIDARQSFESAMAAQQVHLGRVRHLLSDNATQLQGLEAFQADLARRAQIWRQLVQSHDHQAGDPTAGMRHMTLMELNTRLAKLKYLEYDQLDLRIRHSILRAANTEYLVVMGGLIGGTVILIAFVILWGQIVQRIEAESALQHANEALENHVRQRTDELAFANQLLRQEIDEHLATQRQIEELNTSLEARVAERTHQLAAANKELESFSYSVSHDLRAPLRAVAGYSQMLLDHMKDRMDDEDRRLIGVIVSSGQRMGNLIDDLLTFSRLGRTTLSKNWVDMSLLVNDVVTELLQSHEGALPEIQIEPLPEAAGDRALLKQVWANLLSNAIKFSSQQRQAQIVVKSRETGDEMVYEVIDNGAGFDMRYVDKLFGVFQRLHQQHEFPGTGVGLAIVQRVIIRHGGRVLAQGETGKGACFGFTLPKEHIDEQLHAG
nr:sensor histidine kinase [Chitinivorax tropicus]